MAGKHFRVGAHLTYPIMHCARTGSARIGATPGALSVRPNISEIPGRETNGTDIFRIFIPKFWVYIARLA